MAEFQVTASELRNKAQTLSQLNSSLSTQIEMLNSTENNVCSMWEGESKQAFHTAFTHDKGEMEEFRQAIEKYAQALLDIAAKYEDAERRNIQTATERKY